MHGLSNLTLYLGSNNTVLTLVMAMVILIIITHLVLGILYKKKRVGGDHPQLILWTGLISTFIGLTLSSVAQDYQRTKDSRQKALSVLEASAQIAALEENQVRTMFFNILNDLHTNRRLVFRPIDTKGTNPIHLFFVDVTLFNSLGFGKSGLLDDPLLPFIYNSDPRSWSNYDSHNPNYLKNLQELEITVVKYQLFVSLLQHRIEYLHDPAVPYEDYAKKMDRAVNTYIERIHRKTFEDYRIQPTGSALQPLDLSD